MANQTYPFPLGTANTEAPFNPFTGVGAKDDDAMFIQPPGVVFFRPWLSVPNGPSFIWPIGLEGFRIEVSPTLGVHRYIGDNKVAVNVVHRGEESINMTGNLVGDSAVAAFRQLRDVVYAVQPVGGKILFLPNVLPYAQRVAVERFSASREESERGFDMTYSIDFERIGLAQKMPSPNLLDPIPQPQTGKTGTKSKGGSARVFVTTASVNTLRKIAQKKLGSAQRWDDVYAKNVNLFNRLKVSKHAAPDHRLKVGTRVYW